MIKIVYIMGDGRSGSTLLDSVLSNANESISIGECHRFWLRFYEAKSICGCGEPIEVCPLWKQVDNKITEQHAAYDAHFFLKQVRQIQLYQNYKRIPELLKQEEWQLFKEVLKTFYTAITEITGKQVLIDSSKSVAWAYLLQELKFVDLRIVHLERSLTAVANSWKKEVRLPEYVDTQVMMPIKSNLVIAKSWLKIKWMAKRVQKNGAYYFLSYESFCNQPDTYIAQLSQFLALELNTAALRSKPNHAIGGNPMRAGLTTDIQINEPTTKYKLLSRVERSIFGFIYTLSKAI